jgi:peptide/nickel transport system permease protein
MIRLSGLRRRPLPGQAAERRATAERSETWRRLRASRAGVVAAIYLVALGLVAVGAPVLADGMLHVGPISTDLDNRFAMPGEGHWLGTDQLGRDSLARLIYGARVSLGIGLLAATAQILVGGTLGVLAGYVGGWLDDLLMRVVDTILAFPAIFLFLALAIVLRPDAVVLALIIASVGWGLVARLVRGEILSIKQRDYVLAARALGAPAMRVMVRHLLPNVAPILIVAASLSVAQIILAEAALDFLGLGVPPSTPSWGNMLTDAQTLLYRSPLLVILPGTAIATTVLAATIVGNTIRDALDPRLKNA